MFFFFARSCKHLLIAAIGMVFVSTSLFAQVADWDGGTGLWSAAGNWNPAVVPNGASFDVLIDNGDGTDSVVALDINATINTLTIDSGDTLNFNNGRSLTIAGASLANDGDLAINGTTGTSSLIFSNATPAISGGGEITLGDDPQSRISGSGNPLITHGASHTIRGGGTLLANTAGMINNGTILGDGATAVLTIDPDAGGFTNSVGSVVQAVSSAGIDLSNGVFTNNSTIEALVGSRVDLSGATIIGGTLSSTGTGAINIVGTSILDGVTIAAGSTVNQNNSRQATILNGLTNNGTWNNQGTTGSTNLLFSGSQTLGGTGEVVLNNDPQSRLTGSGGMVITHGANHTIRGGGTLLANTAGMINNGTILADNTVALTINPDAAGFTNNNILRAIGAGGIDLTNGVFTNNSTIEALVGSRVDLSGATVVGGTLSSTGTGAINIVGSSTLDGVTIAAGSTVNQNNGRQATILNGLTNNGTWNNQGTTGSTNLLFSGSQTLGGTGEVVLNNDPQSRLTGSGGMVITHGANHTIRGGGTLLANTAGMINNGTILADNTVALTIDPDAAGFTNNNILRATGAGGIDLSNGVFTNNTTIEALAGSQVDLSGAIIIGGTLSSTGTGAINIVGTSTLDGVTIAAGSTVNQNNSRQATILNGLTNNGTWNNQGTTGTTSLFFSGGSQALGGTGEVVLNNDPQSQITGTSGMVITHGANHTIRGGGRLLVNTAGMINNGTIIGDGTVALSIDPDAGGFINNGLIRADASSTVILTNGTFANTPGALIAGDGTIDVSSISFTNDGGVAPGMSPGILNLTGNYSESATATLFIEIGGTTVGTEYDQFAISGVAALGGSLSVDLLGYTPLATDTFTILTAATISGMFSNATSTVTTVEGHTFDVMYNSDSVVLGNFDAVPEPSSLVLLAFGGVLFFRRSK